MNEETIADILRAHVIINKNVTDAMQELAKLPGLKKFIATLKDDKEREHFTRHLRRYAQIYLPDCPFEVTTTNRYTVTEHEASITARRDIQPREEIKYLTGVQVAMTEQQEKSLELARKDFSLVISSRKKTRSLFLGPARFANHDCDANAKLSTKGYDGMQIVAVKPIKEGDEITVSYGDDYFGDDNNECLCNSCEARLDNGWAPYKPAEDDDEEGDAEEDTATQNAGPENGAESQPRDLKRKHDSSSETVAQDTLPASKRRKSENSSPSRPKSITTPLSPIRNESDAAVCSRKELPVASIEESVVNVEQESQHARLQRHSLFSIILNEEPISRTTTPQSSAAESPKSTHSTDATSVDEDQPMAQLDSKGIKIDPESIRAQPTLGVATVEDETETVNAPWSSLFEDDSSSELSDLSDSLDFDDILQQIVKRKRPSIPLMPRTTRSISRNMIHFRVGTPVPDQKFEEGMVKNKRRPGDYMTSKSRLSGKDCKWVECQTCDDQFVQEDSHRGTRKECPRCERHSKLYGYAWPKTDKEGKNDKEERIIDHRSIHRFVDCDEEKTLKKHKPKRKFNEEIFERFSTPRSCRDSSMSLEVESGRNRKRLRKTM